MNCVVRSRRCVRKESRKREKGVYIVNLVAELTSARGRVGFGWRLSRFWQNSADLAEFGRSSGYCGGNRWAYARCNGGGPVTRSKRGGSARRHDRTTTRWLGDDAIARRQALGGRGGEGGKGIRSGSATIRKS